LASRERKRPEPSGRLRSRLANKMEPLTRNEGAYTKLQ